MRRVLTILFSGAIILLTYFSTRIEVKRSVKPGCVSTTVKRIRSLIGRQCISAGLVTYTSQARSLARRAVTIATTS